MDSSRLRRLTAMAKCIMVNWIHPVSGHRIQGLEVHLMSISFICIEKQYLDTFSTPILKISSLF